MVRDPGHTLSLTSAEPGDERVRVDCGPTAGVVLEVQVVDAWRGVAGVAHVADEFTLRDVLSRIHRVRIEMRVEVGVAGV